MTERPILMSAPLVRAILEGRKTQTRLVVKPQPPCDCRKRVERYHPVVTNRRGEEVPGPEIFGAYCDCEWGARCPFGAPGDRLWVRETFRLSRHGTGDPIFAADVDEYTRREKGPWTPAIHMPRAASRITLEVTEVRVERLQEINEGDACAEGVEPALSAEQVIDRAAGWPRLPTYRQGFTALWDTINGERASWASNPWVWAISFRRVEEPSR